MEKERIWQIICLILVVIIIGLSVYTFGFKNTNNTSNTDNKHNATNSTEENGYRRIRIDEDLSTDGKVENLEKVRWNNARITHTDGKLELSIMLNNESKDKKVEAKTLTVKLLDKDGKEIATKDFEMKEIKDNYGNTDIELTFDIAEPVIIYNISIIAK